MALAGVVAYVSCSHNEQRLALVSRLKGLGAQIASRVGKEVSHVVFSRTGGLTAEQKVLEDAELRMLFDRARKVSARMRVCVRWRATWVKAQRWRSWDMHAGRQGLQGDGVTCRHWQCGQLRRCSRASHAGPAPAFPPAARVPSHLRQPLVGAELARPRTQSDGALNKAARPVSCCARHSLLRRLGPPAPAASVMAACRSDDSYRRTWKLPHAPKPACRACGAFAGAPLCLAKAAGAAAASRQVARHRRCA